MKLRTELAPSPFGFTLNHRSGIVTMGSCFSDVIGEYLHKRKFSVRSNPFGTVFNLHSLCGALRNAVEGTAPAEDRVVYRDGLYFHLDYHSEFSGRTAEELLENIQAVGRDLRAFLAQAEVLILTLGTAWVYKSGDEPVSNCHKLPASKFGKHLLGLEEQKELLRQLTGKIRTLNPGLKLVLTVSPVRHIKDGIPENSLSKALLRLVCEEAVKNYPQTFYFPAFEIMTDDLRDYRFYKADLVHPTEMAEEYICSLFMKSAVGEEARELGEEWNKVRQGLDHRPLNPHSPSYRAFLAGLSEKIKAFESHFEVKEEYEALEKRLEALG